jgi:hypothetical protein
MVSHGPTENCKKQGSQVVVRTLLLVMSLWPGAIPSPMDYSETKNTKLWPVISCPLELHPYHMWFVGKWDREL